MAQEGGIEWLLSHIVMSQCFSFSTIGEALDRIFGVEIKVLVKVLNIGTVSTEREADN